jgi:hypothetical protein
LSIDIFKSFQNIHQIFQNCLLPYWTIPENHLPPDLEEFFSVRSITCFTEDYI